MELPRLLSMDASSGRSVIDSAPQWAAGLEYRSVASGAPVLRDAECMPIDERPPLRYKRLYRVEMITGVHALFYTTDPEGARAFIRDKLQLPHFDAMPGWPLSDAPSGIIGCHPSTEPAHGIAFSCDDMNATISELQSRGVRFLTPVQDRLGVGQPSSTFLELELSRFIRRSTRILDPWIQTDPLPDIAFRSPLGRNAVNLPAQEVRRPVDTLEELRAMRRDLYELGDSVASVLLERAARCFLAWRFEEAERLMERALVHFEEAQRRKPETSGPARWFNTCALAVA